MNWTNVRVLPIFVFCCAGTLPFLSACNSHPEREPVYPVRGKVLVHGKPAAGAWVAFHRIAELTNRQALKPRAQTDKSGEFQLSTYDSKDGAPAGDYAVTVYWPGPLPKGSSPSDLGPDRLSGRYASATQTELRVTIKEGENQLKAFDLK